MYKRKSCLRLASDLSKTARAHGPFAQKYGEPRDSFIPNRGRLEGATIVHGDDQRLHRCFRKVDVSRRARGFEKISLALSATRVRRGTSIA